MFTESLSWLLFSNKFSIFGETTNGAVVESVGIFKSAMGAGPAPTRRRHLTAAPSRPQLHWVWNPTLLYFFSKLVRYWDQILAQALFHNSKFELPLTREDRIEKPWESSSCSRAFHCSELRAQSMAAALSRPLTAEQSPLNESSKHYGTRLLLVIFWKVSMALADTRPGWKP